MRQARFQRRHPGLRGRRALPRLPGFGLSFHLGYGYGGRGLGVGGEGGYPFYSGPGYPHEAPPLRRFGRIVPFAYYGGPDYPCRASSALLRADGPTRGRSAGGDQRPDRRDLPVASDYGPFSGRSPIPRPSFAPYATPDQVARFALREYSRDQVPGSWDDRIALGRPEAVALGRERLIPRPADCRREEKRFFASGRGVRRCTDVPNLKFRPGLERLESIQLLTRPGPAIDASLDPVRLGHPGCPPAAAAPELARRLSLVLSRITNPTPTNAQLIPPFQQVRVQTVTPVIGGTYNVLFVSVRNSTTPTFDASNNFQVKLSGGKTRGARPDRVPSNGSRARSSCSTSCPRSITR